MNYYLTKLGMELDTENEQTAVNTDGHIESSDAQNEEDFEEEAKDAAQENLNTN